MRRAAEPPLLNGNGLRLLLAPLLGGGRLLRISVAGLLFAVRRRLLLVRVRRSRLLLVRVLMRVLRVLFSPGRLLLSWPHGR